MSTNFKEGEQITSEGFPVARIGGTVAIVGGIFLKLVPGAGYKIIDFGSLVISKILNQN